MANNDNSNKDVLVSLIIPFLNPSPTPRIKTPKPTSFKYENKMMWIILGSHST